MIDRLTRKIINRQIDKEDLSKTDCKKHQSKVIMQGKLMAVAYTLRTY